MYKNDREVMIQELIKLKLQRKLLDEMSDGDRLKCKPEFVAMVYLLKHMDSVRNFVMDGVEASDEPIEGRLRDIRNYCLLIGALIKENKEQKSHE